MWTLPTGTVVWPDRIRRYRPKDGERFDHAGETYVWDDVISHWTNQKGNIVTFSEESQSSLYGFTSSSLPEQSGEQEKTTKTVKTEGDKLKDFFFPTNALGCECGVWITNSGKHSAHCRLYRKD